MKACNECHVHVAGKRDFCPLCGADLQKSDVPSAAPGPGNAYPDLTGLVAPYDFVRRLLLFLTVLGCGMSVLVNLLVTPWFLWCLIVLAAAVYCWAVIPPVLSRGRNYAKQIVWQVSLTAALVIALDFITGYRGWSVDYVLPGLLSAGILATCLMSIFNRTNWNQYALYQVLIGVFGFIPLLLYLLGITDSLIMVLVTAGLALASILITFIFGDRSVKSEFKRRFHM